MFEHLRNILRLYFFLSNFREHLFHWSNMILFQELLTPTAQVLEVVDL